MLATLRLADGTMFHGHGIGVVGASIGELVFNTAMTGYQEILTDPSYTGQIIVFTCPHIGNTGINLTDNQSNKICVAGVVVRENSPIASNWQAVQSFANWLQQNGIVGMAGVNTRSLTKYIRDHGTQLGEIVAERITSHHQEELTIQPQHYDQTNTLITAKADHADNINNCLIVVIDCGVKEGILLNLSKTNCRLKVVPADTTAAAILAWQPDGIVLSNGPGDPCDFTALIANVQILLQTRIPLLGICLGCQILALALGAKIFKLKFGHHGANHPVQELSAGRLFITSQNHNYAVCESNLPAEIIVTHRSLFDQTIQGIQHKSKPIYGYQWHPEASPGPQDSCHIFYDFLSTIEKLVDYAKTS